MKWTAALIYVALACLPLSRGFSAPIYQIATLGLQGVEHTRNDGYLLSAAQQMNEAGQVVGYAQRYNGTGTNLGQSLWLYDGVMTHPIGFFDAEHTRNDGYKSSSFEEVSTFDGPLPQFNEAGYAAGYTNRYNGTSNTLGRTAWVSNGTTTVKVGLTDAEHTRVNGEKFSSVSRLNRRGQAAGRSSRYDSSSARGGPLGNSAWFYDGTTTQNIGLVGPEHTGGNGLKDSTVAALTDGGKVAGTSTLYFGGSSAMGSTAWLFDGATTNEIGLADPEHTNSNGRRSSSLKGLNESEQVFGYSRRYNSGPTDLGQTAWLYDGSTTLNLGLIGAEHTRDDGYKESIIEHFDDIGHTAGYAKRFNGGNVDLGRSAWIYNGLATTPIGLIDAEHTRADGYQSSSLAREDGLPTKGYLVNVARHVAGFSARYNGGGIALGNSAWLYDGTTSILIGLIDAEHTGNDGYRSSTPLHMNQAGQVSGTSLRYNGGGTEIGWSAWQFNGSNTVQVGLVNSEHTRDDGYRFSLANAMNEAGHTVGTSNRYNGSSAEIGISTWLYRGIVTLNIGLVDAEHTRDDGYKGSIWTGFNQAGHVVGNSGRFNGGGTSLGNSVWFYNGSTTLTIGLVDAEHTRDDGYRRSSAARNAYYAHFNESSQVAGYSERYFGGSTQLGQSGWFYDPQLNQTIPLVLSTRSDGYAFTSPEYLGEDGLVLGKYTLFDTLDNNLGDRLFYFTSDDGLHDLGSLVDGGLAANGWEQLATWLRVNGTRHILGHGLLTSQTAGQMPYLLTQIPEPSTAVICLWASITLLYRRQSGDRPPMAVAGPSMRRARSLMCFDSERRYGARLINGT
jgi:hypothetical protein